MFDFFTKKTATIIHVDENNNVEVSPEFQNVPAANRALATVIAQEGFVKIESGINDDDGATAKVLQPTSTPRIWGEHDYEVIPTEIIHGDDE